MRIVFFIGNLSCSGGTERVLSVVAGGLAGRGHHVSIISLWGDGNSFFPIRDEVKIYWPRQRGCRAGMLRQFLRLQAVLKSEAPDFLVDVDIILGVYSVFMKKLMPGLQWISWDHFNYYHHFTHNHTLRLIVRRAVCRYADQIVVLTDEDRECYRRNLRPKCRITRIYDPDPYERETGDRERERMILAAGRLVREKGFDLLIQSWQILEERYPEWTVLIAGRGRDRKKLESQARKAGLKRLRFIGNVSSVEEYYRRAAFFVLASRSEGFGMVLVEAMHFGLPAVAYSCKGGPKEIILDGENGFLANPGDITGFAGRMEMLMRDGELRRQMGETAKESVKRFEKDKVLDGWEELLKGVGEQRRSGFSHSSGL